jgi:hypothetical protein
MTDVDGVIDFSDHESDPTASRPNIPGYGIMDSNSGKGLLPWSWAIERLIKAHTWSCVMRDP